MQIKYRPHKESDLNFIFATLLKSYRYSNPQARVIDKKTYYENGSKEWACCINNGGKVIVACADDDEDLIIGFFVYSDKIIHYVYVKAAFRSSGIARQLLDSVPFEGDFPSYTHWTLDAGRILDTHQKWKSKYNPYLFKWFGYVEHKGESNERADRSH